MGTPSATLAVDDTFSDAEMSILRQGLVGDRRPRPRSGEEQR
jgi:hypothetical protein